MLVCVALGVDGTVGINSLVWNAMDLQIAVVRRCHCEKMQSVGSQLQEFDCARFARVQFGTLHQQ